MNSLKAVFYVLTSDKRSFGGMYDAIVIGTQTWCLIY